jgi:CRP-like cAMP-binding protein
VPQSANLLLAALPSRIFDKLRPHLSLIELKRGAVLASDGDPISKVYFPESGIISLVVELEVGDMIETAMVGRDGVVLASAALDGKVALNKALVQLAGRALTMSADRLRAIADEEPTFRALLMRHEQVLFAQSQQSGACNASHVVEARLCRWLLRCRDLADGDELTITQEFLAQMLGVRRSSVSITANMLQIAGLIAYRRGRVNITDVDGLKAGACECYEAVRGHYERLLLSGERSDRLRSSERA